MHASLFLAGVALPLALALPPPFPPKVPFGRSPRQSNETCNLATLQQPANTLTPPGADLSLVLVALGHGTQNYTCANATAAPAAIGAVAQLFNASCAVADNDLQELGSVQEDSAAIGAHFFVDSTTPDFDIIGLGNTELKKAESMAAPQATDVSWLKLEAQQAGTNSPVKEVYRLETVGGVAPATCAGKTAGEVVTVDYEAQYWVYATTSELKKRMERRVLGLPVA